MKNLLIVVAIFLIGCQNNNDIKPFTKIDPVHKPWTRWWWMGNAVDEKNLEHMLEQYASAGFGGVEITPIYGVKGLESKYLPYLSDEWMRMLSFTIEKARQYGMEVDMNLGTGWPFGGPQVTPEYSATKLISARFDIQNGEKFNKKIIPGTNYRGNIPARLQALTAYGPDGQVKDLTMHVASDGSLNWIPPAGEWTLYAAFSSRTMQKVKRAAPGGEGLTFDHYSGEALQKYTERFEKAFGNANPGIRAFFNDSYEVYGTDWTDNFFEEFEKRRGYNLKFHLRELTESQDTSILRKRILCDYRETISDLLLENFTRPWTSWSNGYNALTRNQAHGSPGNLIDLYAAVNIPECETFGSSFFPIPGLRRDSADIRNVDPDPVMMKFATSAGHMAGRNLISCETFTWLGEHFKTSLAQCKPEVEQVFLAGVNHVVFHGTTYSPQDASWPGWLFYASVNFSPSNPFWKHLPALNNYIARCQSILQTGYSDNEILVYWPLHDYWMNTNHQNNMLTIHDIDKWLHPTPFYELTTRLIKEGYGVDFISDRLLGTLSVQKKLLVAPSGNTYRAVVFPALTYLSEKTLDLACKLAESGGLVVFSKMPEDVPSAWDLTSRRLELLEHKEKEGKISSGINVAKNIPNELMKNGIHPESLVKTGLQYIRRKNGDGYWYYLVNHTGNTIDEFIALNMFKEHCLIYDPQTGSTGVPQTRKTGSSDKIRIQLRPGETLFLNTATSNIKSEKWEYLEKDYGIVPVSGPWEIKFIEGGPLIPENIKSDTLKPWTEFRTEGTDCFSGTAVYSANFYLPEKEASTYRINVGRVHESARIWINGREAGYCWSLPFTLDISELLKTGQNLIEIEVASLPANRIRWMDQQKIQWRNYHEINFVNIDYKPFDASEWAIMPSGLSGPVVLELHGTGTE